MPTAWAAKLQEPRIAALLPRVRVRATAAYDELHRHRSLNQPPWPAEVEVVLRDGRRLAARVTSPRGDPGVPMTAEEVEEKFTALAGRALAPERVRRVRETVRTLEAVPHIGALTALMGADLG
jgi:2-methylcitrate dehydratase PrpD